MTVLRGCLVGIQTFFDNCLENLEETKILFVFVYAAVSRERNYI